jgi:hypothetical protein
MLTAIVFFILFAIFALLYLESLWSNTITLINVTLAALLALSFFEPMADTIESFGAWFKTCTYLWDYLSLWILFCLFFGILRLFTDFASRTRVKFRPPIEIPGRMFAALLVGLVMVSFILTSFHVSPLPAAPFTGGFAKSPTASTFLFFKPDRWMLSFLQTVSRGSLARGPIPGKESPNQADAGTNAFDPRGEFILKYRQRRRDLEHNDALRVNTGG